MQRDPIIGPCSVLEKYNNLEIRYPDVQLPVLAAIWAALENNPESTGTAGRKSWVFFSCCPEAEGVQSRAGGCQPLLGNSLCLGAPALSTKDISLASLQS